MVMYGYLNDLLDKRVIVTVTLGQVPTALRGVLKGSNDHGIDMYIDQKAGLPAAMGMVNWDIIAFIEEEVDVPETIGQDVM